MIVPRSVPDSAAVAAHYDRLDAFYREAWGEHVHHGLWTTGRETPEAAADALAQRIVEAVGDAGAVVDVGCGYGATSRRIAEATGAARDGAHALRETGRGRRSQRPVGERCVTVLVRDWLENGLASGSADAVVACESTTHMPERQRVFDEMARVLRPGGRLVLCVWATGDAPAAWEVRHLLEPICREGRLAGMGTFAENRAWIERAGLVIETGRGLEPPRGADVDRRGSPRRLAGAHRPPLAPLRARRERGRPRVRADGRAAAARLRQRRDAVRVRRRTQGGLMRAWKRFLSLRLPSAPPMLRLLVLAPLALLAACAVSAPAAQPASGASGFTAEERAQGYALRGDTTVFVFDAALYGRTPERVAVTGAFRGWSDDMDDAAWALAPEAADRPEGLWRLAVPNPEFGVIGAATPFKFRVDDGVWLDPPEAAPNVEGGNLVFMFGVTPPRLVAELRGERSVWVEITGFERPTDEAAYTIVRWDGLRIPVMEAIPNEAHSAVLVPAGPLATNEVHYVEAMVPGQERPVRGTGPLRRPLARPRQRRAARGHVPAAHRRADRGRPGRTAPAAA